MSQEKKDKTKKYKILWCTDSPCVNTGFGRVSQELITRLLETGKYEIHVMGTNDKGDPHPMRDVEGLHIYPLTNFVEDPYGFREFPKILKAVKPDLVFALNDIWVWTGDEKRPEMNDWFVKSMKTYRPYVPWVAYFAVDGKPWDQNWVKMSNDMTKVVCMADWGYEVLSETPGVNMEKVEVIPHGASVDKFYPLPEEERQEFRQKALGITNENLFLVGCVARNQPRKNIPRLVEAFKCFSDGYKKCKAEIKLANGTTRVCGRIQPTDLLHKRCDTCGNTNPDTFDYVEGVGKENTSLYLHMHMIDMRGHRLPKILKDYRVDNVIFRPHHNVGAGVPIEELNKLYNAMDVHVLPSLSGGFELPIIEAQAAGTPNISTRGTAMTEHLDNGKGFPIYADETIVFDDANHCNKYIANLEDLVTTLFALYNDEELRKSVIMPALAYAHTRTWDSAAEKFDKCFEEALASRVVLHEQFDDLNKRKIVLVNQTKDPAILLSMTPMLREMRKKFGKDTTITMACDPGAGSIIDNNKNVDKFIDVNKLWIDQDVRIDGISFNDVTDFIPAYSTNAARFAKMTWEEAWLDQFKLKSDDLKLDLFLNKHDKSFADKCFADSKKFRVGICVDSTHPTVSIGLEKWQELVTLLSRSDKIDTFVFNTERLEIPKGVTMIDHGRSYRVLAACLDKCDLVITLDNAFVHILKALGKQMTIVQGPRDVSYKLGDYDKFTTVQKDKMFECMPCWISVGERCGVSGNENSMCLSKVSSVEIFGSVMAELNKRKKKEKEGAVVG